METETLAQNAVLPGIRVRLLAVDDREENLLAIQAALARPDYDIICVSSGPRAIEEAAKEEFAAILLDVQMPEMDGFETARRIRSFANARSTPIIFITAIHRNDDHARQGYVAGAVDYLYKPFSVEILQAKIAVFADLYRKTREIQRQAELLRLSSLREQENAFLKEAIRTRDEFLSIASHELKTPITPLSLNLQAFYELFHENRIESVPREKLDRMLRTATLQVDRIARLVNDLLDLSRIVDGKFTLEREPVDLGALVGAVLESFADQVKRIGAEIELSLERGIVGEWDKYRLEQVIINLLTNALKYGDGKPIKIYVANDGESGACLMVEDRGIGIAPKDQDRIFRKFDRAVSSRHYGGLGLGLYISKEIVTLHGGTITVESALGQGARFFVNLPKSVMPSSG